MISEKFAWELGVDFEVHKKHGSKYSEDQERDDHGRWSGVGGEGELSGTGGMLQGSHAVLIQALPRTTTRPGLVKQTEKLKAHLIEHPEDRDLIVAALQYTSGSFQELEDAAKSLMDGDPTTWRQDAYDKRGVSLDMQNEDTPLAVAMASSDAHPIIPYLNEMAGNEGGRFDNEGNLVSTGKPSEWLEPTTIGNAESGARLLLGTIADTPETDAPIYRGLRVRPNQVTEELQILFTPGATVTFGIESFTNKEQVAESFAAGRGGGGGGIGRNDREWVIQTEGPHVGLNVSAISVWPQQAEVLISGRFTVVSVEGTPGVTGGRVTIRQESVYDPG